MKRRGKGEVNAYILNLMVHPDTLRMDEYEIRDQIQSHYSRSKNGKPKKRIRPQHVRVLHLEPLVKNRWLRLLPDGKYERAGELRQVEPLETLIDQFIGIPEEYVDSYIDEKESYSKIFGSGNFEDSLPLKEYKEYMEKLYGD